jgi:EAL and modified HD-GYP domain-containing signal transduction protein
VFKWLGKVIPGGKSPDPSTAPDDVPFDLELAPEKAPPAVVPTFTKPVEKPLEAPVITAEEIGRKSVFDDGILARKTIVDRAYHPAAYEFALRPDSTRHGENEALLIVNLLSHLGAERLSASRQTWIRLADADLFHPSLEGLPADRIVLAVHVESRDDAEADDRHLQAAIGLRNKGFRLALADWADTPVHRNWLPFCHYVEVSVARNNPVDVGELPERLGSRMPALEFVATEVDSHEELEYCHRARYHLFRGAFLTSRGHWPRQPKVNPERTRICHLLNQLHKGAELNDIAGQLRQSPELSYRLLRYINSPGVGLLIPVASVQQGLIVLGRDKTYRWLTVLLFSSGQGRSIDTALLEQALVRARLMEMLAQNLLNRTQLEELFTVGIFSLLDLLLKLPMSVALEPLKLPPAVQDALIGETGPYATWLKLASLAEGEDGRALRAAAEELGLAIADVNNAQLEALHWMQEVLSE